MGMDMDITVSFSDIFLTVWNEKGVMLFILCIRKVLVVILCEKITANTILRDFERWRQTSVLSQKIIIIF